MGTIRAAEIGHGLTSTEIAFQKHGMSLAQFAGRCWEIGRLVIATEHRAGPSELKQCMAAAMRYFIAHEDASHFFAICVPALARLYRRFGFSILMDNVMPASGTFVMAHATRADLVHGLLPESHASGVA